ncbi:MAG TPA: Trk system potassium transporter TrkA [Myxococcota bacterium]|nr:Trk system potassium transporter TrkA [Myxococcota bacterium]HON25290.1 Trk system potassium transporter TrkA [Myxococcota bacterium]HOS62285.1 Trk system potassium transporter TrkA [Myxococcota bacterium]HPC92179.1 Trk system potassium transporter TrkA [Myxococcota bacterium]HPL25362.1 Trk system potassium transporter TrkA [Myxococcota bacterium]
MKVIIIGAGFTGTQLAKRLISERNDVVLIDKDEETVRHASNRLDCMVMQASGNNLAVLEEAGIEKADFLVALTESDELNMITCSLVDSVYPNVVKIARVRNSDYYNESSTRQKSRKKHRPPYGINFMVHPDIEAAEAIVHAIKWDGVSESIDFKGSDYQIVSVLVRQNSKFDGLALQEIKDVTKRQYLVVYIEGDNLAYIPKGSAVLHAGDRIGVLCKAEDTEELFFLCGEAKRQLNKIAILGAGRVGLWVASRLLHKKRKSFFAKVFSIPQELRKEYAIIEKDEALAKNAAMLFPEASIFKADITDEGFVEQERLDTYDLLIATTNNYELNIVTAAYLKSLGNLKTVCLVTNSQYARIANNIGVDVAIPTKDVVIDAIMSHLRGRFVTRIHTLFEGEIEIAEVTVSQDSFFNGKVLKDTHVEGVFLVLLRKKQGEDKYSIPRGDTRIELNDSIVVLYDKDKHTGFGFGEHQ